MTIYSSVFKCFCLIICKKLSILVVTGFTTSHLEKDYVFLLNKQAIVGFWLHSRHTSPLKKLFRFGLNATSNPMWGKVSVSESLHAQCVPRKEGHFWNHHHKTWVGKAAPIFQVHSLCQSWRALSSSKEQRSSWPQQETGSWSSSVTFQLPPCDRTMTWCLKPPSRLCCWNWQSHGRNVWMKGSSPSMWDWSETVSKLDGEPTTFQLKLGVGGSFAKAFSSLSIKGEKRKKAIRNHHHAHHTCLTTLTESNFKISHSLTHHLWTNACEWIILICCFQTS